VKRWGAISRESGVGHIFEKRITTVGEKMRRNGGPEGNRVSGQGTEERRLNESQDKGERKKNREKGEVLKKKKRKKEYQKQ